MRGASHQTVRLARGRHESPDSGACVMELASMLAGERFSDRPRCVDPLLAAFLRAFNDRLHARHRQRLLPYASLAVGTRGDGRDRRARCLAFLGHAGLGLQLRARLIAAFGLPALLDPEGAIAELAARRCARDPEAGFALLDTLVDATEVTVTSVARPLARV